MSDKSKQGIWDRPRDPDRIPEILGLLEQRWKETPDQRLGQVIMNLIRREASPDPAKEGQVIFALEDDRWKAILASDDHASTQDR